MPAVLLVPIYTMPSRATRQLNPYRYGWGGAYIAYNLVGTTKNRNLKNDQMAVVDVELRLCMSLRGREDSRHRRHQGTTIMNSILTVLAIDERLVEKILAESGLVVSAKSKIVK